MTPEMIELFNNICEETISGLPQTANF